MKLLIDPQALLALLVTAALCMAAEPPNDDDPNATFSILPITTETQTLTVTTTTTTAAAAAATATGPTGPVAQPPNIVPPSGFVTIMVANTAAAPPVPTAEPTAVEKLEARKVPAAPEEQATPEEPAALSDPELLAALEKIMTLAALDEQVPATNPATLAARDANDDYEDLKNNYEYDPDDPLDIPENYKFDKYGNRKKKILKKYPQHVSDPENKKGHHGPTFDNPGEPFCFRWPGGEEGKEAPKCPNGDNPTFSWRCTVLNVPFSTDLNLNHPHAERFFKCPGLVKGW